VEPNRRSAAALRAREPSLRTSDRHNRLTRPRGLQRVGQLRGGLGYCGVGVDDVGQVVAGAGLVELAHCGVEAGPGIGWAAAAGPGAQFVWRTRPFGIGDGPPCQSCLERSGVSVAHRGRRLGERSQSIAKPGVGRCLLVGAHRAAPRCAGVVD
jgi:hypothetical protein